jgi:hypothetical protein
VGNLQHWLIFLVIAGAALTLPALALVVLILTCVSGAQWRWRVLVGGGGAAGLTLAAVAFAALAWATEPGLAPAGLTPGHAALLGVPAIAAAFLAGAAVGYLSRASR